MFFTTFFTKKKEVNDSIQQFVKYRKAPINQEKTIRTEIESGLLKHTQIMNTTQLNMVEK